MRARKAARAAVSVSAKRSAGRTGATLPRIANAEHPRFFNAENPRIAHAAVPGSGILAGNGKRLFMSCINLIMPGLVPGAYPVSRCRLKRVANRNSGPCAPTACLAMGSRGRGFGAGFPPTLCA